MSELRAYRLECWWLVLVLVVLLLVPARASVGMGFDWQDLAWDCDGWSGWCVPVPLP